MLTCDGNYGLQQSELISFTYLVYWILDLLRCAVVVEPLYEFLGYPNVGEQNVSFWVVVNRFNWIW